MTTRKLGSVKLTDNVLVPNVALGSEVSGILSVANGGTGQSVYTDGQLLIGNTTGNTLVKSTLTAGAGITITNGSGAITIENASPTQWLASGSNIYFNTGNVAIGTTPIASAELLVRGGGATNATWSLFTENSAATNTFFVRDDGAVGIPNGNLGIGTSPTTQRLQVNGTTTISGQLTLSQADGTAPMVVTSTTRVANLNVATAGTADTATNYNGIAQATYTPSLRSNVNISGGGTITVSASGDVLWSQRFIVISNGRGSSFGTSGFFDITCPVTGTITGVGGAANKTATAAGIPLAGWEALYYILPIGSANTSVAANFRVASYTAALDIPHNWVLICVRNGDNSIVKFSAGYELPLGGSIATATYDARRANTADILTTTRTINGVNFNGSANITVAADAGTLTGNTLASGVTASSLTSVGTLTSLAVSGNASVGPVSSGADGLNVAVSRNLTFGEGTNNSYLNLFRQANSGGTVLANGYKFSTTADGFASSTSVAWAKSAIRLAGDIQFYADASTTVANGTDETPTPRMFIGRAGNVGIGTTSPSSRLHVVGNIFADNANGSVIVRNGDATNQQQIRMRMSGNNGILDVTRNSGTAPDLIFGTEGTEQMRITAASTVGIGTSSPGAKLHVFGGDILRTNSDYVINSAGSGFVITHASASGATDAMLYAFRGGNTSYGNIVIPGGGLGIGMSTSPLGALHVQGATLYLSTTTDFVQNTTGSGLIIARGAATGNTYSSIYAVQTGGADYANLVVPGGNVGIGTTSPDAKLQVVGTTFLGDDGAYVGAGSPKVVVYGAGATEVSSLWFQAGIGSALAGFKASDSNFYITNTYAGNALGSNGITIGTTGNVGIGTTSPDYRLTIITPTSDATIGFNLRAYTTGADGDRTTISRYTSLNNNNWAWHEAHAWAHIWKCNGTEQMRLTSGGNVGIGTTNPGNYRLNVSKGAAGDVAQFTDGVAHTFLVRTDASTLFVGQANNFPLALVTNNTEKVRITAAGNVGIGTTSPGVALDVSGNIRAVTAGTTRYITAGSDTQGAVFEQRAQAAWGDVLQVYRAGALKWALQEGSNAFVLQVNGSERLRVDSSGNVGIGTTSPSARLHVVGNQYRQNDATNSFGFVINTTSATTTLATLFGGSSFAIQTGASGTNQLLLDSSGNLGIGTTSPTQKLHVNGNATAADFILTSDRRLKRDLVEITGALATVLSWAGYTYRPVGGERRRAGLMAQDVEPTAPELVYTSEDGYKSLSYEQAVPYLVEAIRDLHRMIEALA